MKKLAQVLLILLISCSCLDNRTKEEEPVGANNLAYKWSEIALTATAYDTKRFRPRPTVTSRMLGLTWTAVFDAWSRFDNKAVPLYLKNVQRVPLRERILKNKEKAISYAAYRAMLTYFFSDSLMLRKKMKEFGYDPDNNSFDPTTPEGVGRSLDDAG